jgi:HD-like signal output (HDOD) protein/CheY-like chemotaxis protein
MLHSERTNWEAHFAPGPHEALAMLEENEFDVVMSDMQMPGMDGADLLVQVRQRFPATVRIVLSGHSERASAVKAASVAHQFLNKPTDAQVLMVAVNRARELERRLGQTGLRSVLGGIDGLPSPSNTIRSLNVALSDPTSDVDRVVQIIEPDLGISSKILQLVNSAFFALPREVASLHEAVAYLGLENVRAVATSADVFQALGRNVEAERLAGLLQAHSLGVMQLARFILPQARRPSDLFLGALLHDIGLLATAALVPGLWAELGNDVSGPWTLEKERVHLGATHADIGAYLLCLWGMSYGAVEVVGRHHDPEIAAGGSLDEVQAVYLAEALFSEVADIPGHEASLGDERADALGVRGQLEGWRARRDILIGGSL